MKNSTKLSLIAAAVGGLMAGTTARAASPSPVMSGKTEISKKSDAKSTFAGTRAFMEDEKAGKHDCKGKNECKGQGGCKSSDAGCKGKNTCKGHGGCKSDMKDHDKKEDKKE